YHYWSTNPGHAAHYILPERTMWMSAVEDVRILDRDGNWAVIWLPGRRFPGVFLQDDTMSTIRDLLADLDAESLHGLGEDVRDRILEARERLEELMAYYEATLVANGIPRPF